MMGRVARSSNGLTLVEILISLGLMSGLGLVIATILIQTSQNGVTARGKAGISGDLTGAGNMLENLLTNTVRVHGCTCTGTDPCIFSTATESVATNASLLDWETETAMHPAMLPLVGDGCLLYGAANPALIGVGLGGAESGMYYRGCRQRFRLSIVEPTPNSPPDMDGIITIGTPGVLSLDSLDGAGVKIATMLRLEGVTGIRCGMSPIPEAALPSYADFHIDLKMKIRVNQFSRSVSGRHPESWDPAGGRSFLEGIHRQIALSAQFRNQIYRGIHFGMTESFLSCQPVGDTNIQNCCSGYHDGTKCIAETSCLLAGSAVWGSMEECCSKSVAGGFCI